MSISKTIRVYDYVNHPYAEVREKLISGSPGIFRDATKSAAGRAKSVASELRVNFAGIEVGADISISVTKIQEQSESPLTGQVTQINLEWEASRMPRLFPFMKANLSLYALTATETQLDLLGNYEPPFGLFGSAMDAVIGHRIAEASVHQFIADVAAYLRSALPQFTVKG